jgi:hypothetical protein
MFVSSQIISRFAGIPDSIASITDVDDVQWDAREFNNHVEDSIFSAFGQ